MSYVFSTDSDRPAQYDPILGVSRHEFLADPQLQDSVIRRIEIVGEATGRLSLAFGDKHPEIP